nr:NAD(P)/FAD-dependent oxidoreductase [Candidatus Freyarchaeota archaeon]
MVIGCGPAGAIAARSAARKGVKVAIFEEHQTVGLPEHCAGLISISGIERLNIDIPKKCIVNSVRGATFYSPSGASFSVSRRGPQAYVVDRPSLDQHLANEAQKDGVLLFTGARVTALKMGAKKTLKVSHGRESTFEAECVIDAEGVRGKFVREAGLTPPSGDILPGVQFEVENAEVDPDRVEMFFGNSVAPGFFAWIIPTGENSARVGVGARHHAMKYLKKFIENHPVASERLADAALVKKYGGSIVLCGPVPKTFTDSFLVVGDAAGQVKPTTGGGVVMGGLCAQIAGDVAAEAVIEGNTGEGKLRNYQKKWRRLLSREFYFMRLVRRILNRMSDRNLDKIFETIIRSDLTRIIEEVGDMDFESAVIKKLIFKPRLSARIVLAVLASLLSREERKEY